ncbi:MAG: hypothetical protein J6X71_01215 [Bacteroidales bacterium]|nr:hypothetical protein [Bacteroidales bacterium]
MLLVPEQEDISLSERCRRVNAICQVLGTRNVILISIHANAASRGDRWYDATGWCAYTTRGDTRADARATSLYEAATFHLPGKRMVQPFGILLKRPIRGVFVDVGPMEPVPAVRRIPEVIHLIPLLAQTLHHLLIVRIPPAGCNVDLGHSLIQTDAMMNLTAI